MNKTFKFFLYVLAGILGIALGALVLLHPPQASLVVDPDTVSTAPFFTDVPPPWVKIKSSPEWEKLSPEQKGILVDKWYRAVFDHGISLGGVGDDDKKKLYDFYQKVHAEAVTVPLGLAIFRLFPGAMHFLLGASLLAGGITAFWRAGNLALRYAVCVLVSFMAAAYALSAALPPIYSFNAILQGFSHGMFSGYDPAQFFVPLLPVALSLTVCVIAWHFRKGPYS